MRPEQILYRIVCMIIGVLFVIRAVNFSVYIHINNFKDGPLWIALALVAGFHLFLLFTAYLYERFYKGCSVLFYYLFLSLGIYLLYVVNALFFSVPDAVWIRLSVLIIFIPVGVKLIRHGFVLQRIRLSFSMQKALIVLWGFNAFLFFIRFTFHTNRAPYKDELSLWFVAARDMIQQSILAAHATAYGGAGLHPLSIPFFAALPAKFWGISDLRAIYLMPIAIILLLIIFLYQIRKQRWAFVFFLCALSAVFYQKAWLTYFLYGLVYGEGFSTVFLLTIIYEWARMDTRKDDKAFLWLSFGIGLLALTKLPLFIMVLPIYVCFIWSAGLTRSSIKVFLRPLFFSMALVALPFLAWKAFTIYYPVVYWGFDVSYSEIISRVGHPHAWMLTQAFYLMWNNSNNLFLYGLIVLIFYLFSKRLICGIPLLLLMGGIFIYYAYCYNYGMNNGDPGSSLRYAMPSFLAFFYLAALGFENVMQAIESKPWRIEVKLMLLGVLSLVLMWGVWETRTTEKIVQLLSVCRL